MEIYEKYLKRIRKDLSAVSTAEKADSSRRYFPQGIHCCGATAGDVKTIINNFLLDHPDLTSADILAITEYMLARTKYNEEFLIAFGLMNKFVKLSAKRTDNFDDELLLRFEYWLEHYANNWSLVDDLCIKTLYQFLISRPYLIVKTQHWAYSEIPWCRRASCVVWVKFIKRKIGKEIYYLDTQLIFKQCDLLLDDSDEYVQKGVGWLLKVTSVEHKDAVISYIKNNRSRFTRPTLRYAIEKMDDVSRRMLLAI